jgi:pimeloyl-ACP methyl ester carboxylesterase
MRAWNIVVLTGALLMNTAVAEAQSRVIPDGACTAAPRMICPDGNCPRVNSGRDFLLDYPCDLQTGDKLVFLLLLHGAGSSDIWVRSYFPAVDYKEKYRLVIATPHAGGENRIWNAQTDDRALQDITERVFAQFGRSNIRSFWVAGHSQGGITAARLVCNDYFKARVDGLLSLSGGRIGPAELAPDFFAPPPGGTPEGATAPPLRAASRRGAAPAAPLSCDFSYVFAVGQHEIVDLPDSSPWAEKYGCRPRQSQINVADARAGYVTGANQPRNASFGRMARSGIARVMVYPDCKDGRIVADVMRMDKGHTEGLEPAITEEIIRLMITAPGR